MVYGPGGYTAKNFFLTGLPVQLTFLVVAPVLLTFTDVSNMYLSWLAAIGLVLVVAFATAVDYRACLPKRWRPSEDDKP